MNNQQEPEAAAGSEAEDRYSSPARLIKIASWAYFSSWVVLVLNIILFLGRLYTQFLNGWSFDLLLVFNLMFYLSTLVIGIVWFVVLQAISEGIYLWLDIDENQAWKRSDQLGE